MPTETQEPGDRDERVNEVLAAFREDVEQGNAPDTQDWLHRYPEIADELAAHFENESWFLQHAGLSSVSRDPEKTVAHTPGEPDPGGASSRPSATQTDQLPEVPGHVLLAKLGEGGFGEVYKARELKPEREVAIKMYKQEHRGTLREEALFRAEADRIARLEHDNILTVYQASEVEGCPYFTMRLVEGGTLAEHQKHYSEDLREAVALLRQIADALHHAHQRGLLHRDLKPSNILLDADRKPYVADFGLSRFLDREDPLAHPGAIEGSAPYMAAEQARGAGQLTVATDVYGLGAILYFLLTGQPPHRGSDLLDTLLRVRESPPTSPRKLNPRVDRDLNAICLKCLHKEPAARYPSAADLAADLQRWQEGRPVRARPLNRANRLWRQCRRHPTLAGLTLLAVLLLFATLGSFWHGYRQTQQALAESRKNHFDSLVREARAARFARLAGYRDVVWARLVEALSLDIPALDLHELRMEAVACMGDFLGPKPTTWNLSPHEILSLAIRPGGTEFVVGMQDGTLVVLDGKSKEEVFRENDTGSAITFLDWDPSGKQLISGDQQGQFRIWKCGNNGSLSPAGSFQVSSPPASAAFTPSPTGGYLAVCSLKSNEIRIYTVPGGKPVARFKMPGSVTKDMPLHPGAQLLDFSPDAHLLVAAFKAEGRYSLVPYMADPPGQMKQWKQGNVLTPQRGHIHTLAFSPDGQKLFCGCGQGFLRYDTKTLQEELFIPGDIPADLAISPDNRMLALASAQLGVLRLWGLGSPQTGVASLHHPPLPAKSKGFLPMHSVAFSPDGRFLVGVGGSTVRLWQIRGGLAEASILAGHSRGIPGLAFARGGKILASASKDGTIVLWDLAREKRGERLVTIGDFPDAVQTLAFLPGDSPNLLATGDFAGEIHLYHLSRNKGKWTWQRTPDQPRPDREIWSVAFSPDRKWFAAGGWEGLRLWPIRPGVPGKKWLGKPNPLSRGFVRQVCFGPQGKWLAWVEVKHRASDGPGKIFVLSLQAFQKNPKVAPDSVGRTLGSELSLAFVGEHPRLAFVDDNNKGKVLDLPPGRGAVEFGPANTVSRNSKDHHEHRPHLALGSIIAVSPAGRYLASAQRRYVSLWDLQNSKELIALPDAPATVWSLAWGEGGQLAVGTSDGGLTVWRLPEIRNHLKNLGLDWKEGN